MKKIIIFALIIIHLCNGSRRLDKLFYAIKFSFQQHFPYQSSEYDTPLFITGSSEIWSEKLCIKRRKPLDI